MILPTTFVSGSACDEILGNCFVSASRMLQLLVVHKQALIDEDGSLWVLCSSHFSVTLIGLLLIPNLYDREKHSRYEPEKMLHCDYIEIRLSNQCSYRRITFLILV